LASALPGIAGNALRLCAVGFALPIIWIYHPEIFLDTISLSTLPATAMTLVSLVLAIIAFNAAHIGFFFSRLPVVLRLVLAGAAIAAVYPDDLVQAAATAVIAVLLALRYLAYRKAETVLPAQP